jgi:hypothetical protein
MRKKDILKKLKEHTNEHCRIYTAHKLPRKFTIDNVEYDVDITLLHKVASIMFTELERNDDFEIGMDAERAKRFKESTPDTTKYGFSNMNEWFWTRNTHTKLSMNSFMLKRYYTRYYPYDNIYSEAYEEFHIPCMWYMLAVYPHIEVDMLDQMTPGHLEVLKLNPHISAVVRGALESKLNK